MASRADVEREGAALQNALYNAGNSGDYVETEEEFLSRLHLSVVNALRGFTQRPSGNEQAYAASVAASTAARNAVGGLTSGDDGEFTAVAQRVNAAVQALRAATA